MELQSESFKPNVFCGPCPIMLGILYSFDAGVCGS